MMEKPPLSPKASSKKAACEASSVVAPPDNYNENNNGNNKQVDEDAAMADNVASSTTTAAASATYPPDYGMGSGTVATNSSQSTAVPDFNNADTITTSNIQKPQNWHTRTVSWGMDTMLGPQQEIIFSRSNSQSSNSKKAASASAKPNTNKKDEQVDEDDENARQTAYIQNLFAGAPPRRHKNVSSLGNVDLSDVLKESPMEHEAETYILKAIERREANAGILRSRTTSDTSVTFPNIPDDAIPALSTIDGQDQRRGRDRSNSHSQSNASVSFSPSLATTGGAASQHSPATMQSPRRTPRKNLHKTFHRRNQTMEQHLFGLTSAIDALHTQDDSGSSELFGEQFADELAQEPYPETSAKALERNANLLVNRDSGRRRRRKISLFGGGNGGHVENDAYQDDSYHKGKVSVANRDRTTSDAGIVSNSSMSKSFRKPTDYKKTDGDTTNQSGELLNQDPALPSSTSESDIPTNTHNIVNVESTLSEPSIHLADNEEGREFGSDRDLGNTMAADNTGGAVPTTDAGHTTTKGNGDGNNNAPATNSEQKKRTNKNTTHNKNKRSSTIKAPQAVRELQNFFEPQRNRIALYLRVVFLYLGLPLLGIAAILFYFVDNPGTGRLANSGRPDVNGTLWYDNGKRVPARLIDENYKLQDASISWWLIFVVRQLITFTLAKLFEKVFVDYLTIRSRGTISVLGPWLTLFILQSRGWPSTLSLWAIFNFCFLAGPNRFAAHWLFWQDYIGLFNFENPAGNVVNSTLNIRILVISLVLGIIVSLKRLFLGLYLGKRTFTAYADQLANIMKKILLISEVAALAKDFEREMKFGVNRAVIMGAAQKTYVGEQREKLHDIYDNLDVSSVGNSTADKSLARKVDYIIDPEDRNPWSGVLSYSQQQRIIQLLGAWEEPVIAENQVGENISVSALLQFRRSMACLNNPTPFGGAFGLADTREHCIQSAQDLYRRLLLNEPGQTELNFETLALLGLQRDGTLDQPVLKDLIRLLRPDRDGTLDILHFVKSIDNVYKEIRLLRASVTNSSKIDKSFETIVNWIFYAIAFTIILSQLGYSPMALFLSISGVILAFAFMIGSASSKYFEGLLFILVRQPYAIGDGIHVMNIESEGMYTGHPFWYVEDVTLFTTSVLFMFTGERATLSNGSLANSRIVNASRTSQASIFTLLKFPVDVSLEKLQVFNSALEQFFRNRPREWRSYDAFRATRLDAQAGFIEYVVVGTHRNSWYNWGTIQTSKADMIHFCMELSKKLGIVYRTPPMPVDLSIKDTQRQQLSSLTPVSGGPSTAGLGGATMPNEALSPITVPPPHPDLTELQSLFPPRLR